MAYNREIKKRILIQLKAGIPISEIVKASNISDTTIRRWSKEIDKIETKDAINNIKNQIEYLSALKPSESITKQISMLTKALDRLERVKKAEKPKRAKKKPTIKDEKVTKELIERALNGDYFREYQKEFIKSNQQFEIILKARQIGFTYVSAFKAMARGAGGRDQIFFSASEDQALLFIQYAKEHADREGISWSGSNREIVVNQKGKLKALAHNFRTGQGFSGDVWMDEFAWYQNQKKMWGAIVPSIGAVKGSLTILSTPFEEQSLFYELYHNKEKYYMFKRYKIDIYDAINGGLEFDLETMRNLFDEETWASAYECQFIDDDTSFFPISLIKSVVNPNLTYYLPLQHSILKSGFDIGRKKDLSSLASFEKSEKIYTLAIVDTLKKASFETQKKHLKDHLRLFHNSYINIDMTGIGMNLAEDMERAYPNRVSGVYFTAQSKELMTLNFKKALEDKKIEIPNDPILISDIHSIKRKAGVKRMLYDSDRNSYGHADRYWACALALKDSNFINSENYSRGGAIII